MSVTTLSIAIAAISLFWVELVRDCYHALSHVWQPLYKLHVWHHKVFRRDLSVTSEAIYQKAHWYNDVPEAVVMLIFSFAPWTIASAYRLDQGWLASLGVVYTLLFLAGAIARGIGIPGVDELTDLTHRPGKFQNLPAPWMVNRSYHWRHHFDNQNAYFSGTLTVVDKLMGTALSLKGKKIAVTGASGTLGQALLKRLYLAGAKVTALTSSGQELALEIEGKIIPIETVSWQIDQEDELLPILEKIDILVLNHGINVGSSRTKTAIAKSYTINAFSVLRLMDIFFGTVRTNEQIATKEVWINTSEAEANPAFSPLYELSKRTLGDLVTLRRLDAPCVVRKLVLGPFKSQLNPVGIMSADWIAKQIVNSAKRDSRNIIVTVNPLTFITFPSKEVLNSLYFKLFSKDS